MKPGPKPVSWDEYVERSTCYEALTGCLLWIGPRNGKGYGEVRLRAARSDSGTAPLAHRTLWEKSHGPIPHGMMIRHHCDNPSCVNISHLAIGTNDDNVADMWARNRASHGERHATKLTAAAVVSIRSDARPLRLIAADHGVCIPMVSMIKNRKCWRHVP